MTAEVLVKKIALVLLTSFFFGLLAGAQEGVTVTRGPGITSVTGTAPIVSSGGSAPDISCTAAGAGVTGCLTSTGGRGYYDAGMTLEGTLQCTGFVVLPNGTSQNRFTMSNTGSASFITAGDVTAVQVNSTGILSTLYGNMASTSTLDIASSTDDATASTTVGAITLRASQDLTDGDLVLNVENSAGTNICTVDEQGDVAATSFGNVSATATLDLVSTTNDATTSATVAAVTIRPTVDLTAGDLVLNIEDSAGTNICTVDEQGAVAATSFTASSLGAFGPGGISTDGGIVLVASNIIMPGASGIGVIYLDTGKTKYVYYNGTNVEMTGTLSLVGTGQSSGTWQSSVASGSNGLACNVSGCRFDFGAGASDYASSDGTTVTFAGPVSVTGITASTGSGTAGSGTGITVNTTGAVRPFIHKITVTFAAMTAAATTDITVWTLPAKARLNRVIGDYTIVFAGGALTDVDVTCGKTAGASEYLTTHDVDTATGTFGLVAADIGAALLGAAAPTLADVNWASTQAIICRFTCAGANCDAATTGSVTYYLEGVTYP